MYREIWHSRFEEPDLMAEKPFYCAICTEEFDEDEEPYFEIKDKRVCEFCYRENQFTQEKSENEKT